jgi:amino acid adenylation domain-containing protein
MYIGAWQPDLIKKTVPVLVYDEGHKGTPTLTLHFHRAVLDTRSILLVWHDFNAFYKGLGFPVRVPFDTHLADETDWVKAKLDGQSAGVDEVPVYGGLPSSSDVETPIIENFVSIEQDLIMKLARRFQLDIHTLIRAAWAHVLSRHVESDQVAFYTNLRPNSPRLHGDTIGPLEMILPVAISMNADETIGKFAKRLDEVLTRTTSTMAVRRREHIGAPMLQVGFYVTELDVAGCEPQDRLKDVPLQVCVCLASSRLVVRHHQGISTSKGRAMLEHLRVVLERMSESSKSHIMSKLGLVSPQERAQLLQFSQPRVAVDALASRSINDLIEKQAAKNGEAKAVETYEGESLTFTELNSSANWVARQLLNEPLVQQSKVVPLHMDTSAKLIITILAVLKAGKGYVILDPSSPVARKSYVIQDVGASFAVTDGMASNVADSGLDSAIYTLDIATLLSQQEGRQEANLDLHVEPETTAYIIYTSGTQGSPKGVDISHRAAASGIACASETAGTRALLFYNPVFSAAQRSILSTLAHGACLCTASRSTLHTSLKQVINEMRINKLGITSSTIGLLDPESMPALKRITLTGERVDQAVVDRWAGHVEDLRNGYGLSECTQLSFGRGLGQPGDDRRPNVLGRPSDTTAAFVLDAGTVELTPLHVAGELCLEGPQLASGYINKPEETARSFVPSPFTEGAALYRTGDMAVRHGDGSIEIVGRIDFQAKINGQRVEPGEIAALVHAQDGVEEAAVVACSVKGDADTALVAMVVPAVRDGAGADAAAQWSDLVTRLRGVAASSLPIYMVPRYWVRLDALPRSANGKTEIKRLRSQVEAMERDDLIRSSSRALSSAEQEVCQGEAEEILRSVWSKVLSLPLGSISRRHAFLELGGDSLNALGVIAELVVVDWVVSLGDLMRAESLTQAAQAMTRNDAGAFVNVAPFSLIPSDFTLDAEQYDDVYPVTELQSGIISAHATIGGYVYNRIFSVDAQSIDWAKLQVAFQKVVDENSIYRSVFIPSGAGFAQAVKKHFALPWEFVDCSDDPDFSLHDFNRSLEAIVDVAESAIKVTVLNRSLLVVSMHHAIFDFWSSQFLFEDASDIYRGLTPVPRPQFNSFVSYAESLDKDKMDQFWAQYLEGAATTQLGAEQPCAPNTSSRRPIAGDIREFTSSTGFSIGVLLYLTWAIVLAKHTGNLDVTFAITLSGRDVPVQGVQQLNGPTLTTVPLRVRFEDGMDIAQGLSHVQGALWDLAKHAQHGLRRSLRAGGHSSDLFDTLVNFLVVNQDGRLADKTPLLQPYGDKPIWQTGYTGLELQEDSAAPGHFVVGLSGTLDPTRTEFLVQEVASIMEGILEDSTKRIADMDIITPPERSHLNRLSPPAGHHPALLHSKFEEVSASCPDRTAIQYGPSVSCTYGQLDGRANQVARFLRSKGLGPGSLVPICLPKSIEAIVATLAVLKAGAAFVPLDPDNPPERNNFIVEDVSATVVLTDENLRGIFDTKSCAADVVDVYAIESSQLDSAPLDAAEVGLEADCLAYCIYTSGSTGLPKGVLVSHGAISAGIDSIIEAESVEPGWRLLQFSNFVFDVSVSDIFCMLGVGATLCMAPMEAMLSDLARVINDMAVTRLFITPTVAKLLRPDEVPGVEGIYLAGEPVPQDMAETWTARGCTIMNCYGPTEASVLSVVGHINAGEDARIIGRPLRNVRALVLETNGLREVPYGAVGELCLAGPQLARGYLNRLDATAKAFVTRHGERVYRTGDLVRWLPDGRMRCLGRIDSQVKIHGHRIEMGEIESAIQRTGLVRDAAVVVHEFQGMPTIVACCAMVKASNGANPGSPEGLLPPSPEHVEALTATGVKLTSLPPYMVPTLWIPVTSLPLLASGKTDRKKLTAWVRELSPEMLQEYAGTDSSAGYVAAETTEEVLLQSLWADLFRKPCSAISATSSFLAHGGDSIAAINLVGRARTNGYSLAVGDTLAFPLLQDMARRMRPLDTKSHGVVPRASLTMSAEMAAELVRSGIHEADVEVIFPVVPGIQDFLVRAKKPGQFWNCQAVRPLPEEIDFDTWVRVTTELTVRNEILRSVWLKTAGVWSQVVLRNPALDLEVVQVRDADAEEDYIQRSWDEGFTVGNKPFVKYRLLVLADGTRELLIHIHHAMYDGTLLRIFDDEFKALYNGLPPPPTVPFGDFVTHLATGDRQPSLEFWESLLRDSPPPFPGTIPDPSASQVYTATVDRQADLFASTCGVTAPIVFQTAFSLLLARLSGRNDVVYDNLITGRNVAMEDAQAIAGTCANFLPFRTSFEPRDGLRGLLRATQDLFWRTTEHGNVGLDDIYGRRRGADAARALFLFQPFEPAAPAGGVVDRHMRWIVMGLSHVRMPMDYALHLEVSKTPAGYRLKFKYDPRIFGPEEGGIEYVAGLFKSILENMLAHSRSSIATIIPA